jgi:hypothetical protein
MGRVLRYVGVQLVGLASRSTCWGLEGAVGGGGVDGELGLT